MMTAKTIRLLAGSMFAFLMLGADARGDQIVVRGENFRDADVVSLTNGLLQFRGSDGTVRSAHLGDIDLLIATGGSLFDDFNQAERFLDAGDPKKAAIRYKRALRMSTDYWSDLIAARLVVAYDRTMETDKSVQQLIRVTRGKWAGPAAGARLIPQNLPDRRTGTLARAVRELDGALAAHPQLGQSVVFEATRYELLRRMKDELAVSAAVRLSATRIPAEVRTEQVYNILVSAMLVATSGGDSMRFVADLDRAIVECPAKHLPDFLLMKGEVLFRSAGDRDDLIRASWPFLRVGIQMADDPRGARGLLGAAKVLVKLEDGAGARRLLGECIAFANADGSVVAEAQQVLEGLAANENSND